MAKWRMVEMTLLLGVLTPMSIRWMQSRWHLAHRFVTVIYFIDIVRRHSHPHSWVLNTPVFAIWIIDKILCMVYRRIKVPNVIRHTISDDYMVLYWSTSSDDGLFNEITAVGSNYYMKLYPSSWMESSHPFTTFKNRSGNCDILMKSYERNQGDRFSNGAIIRVFDNKRSPRIGGPLETRSHTGRIFSCLHSYLESSNSPLSIWGPFQGQVTNLISKALLDEKDSDSSGCAKNIILAGSGSAINFMIDLMSHFSSVSGPLRYENISKNVKTITFLHSTRDEGLHEWTNGSMQSLLSAIAVPTECNGVFIRIILACTKKSKKDSLSLLNQTEHLNNTLNSSRSVHSVAPVIDPISSVDDKMPGTECGEVNHTTPSRIDTNDVEAVVGKDEFTSSVGSISLVYERLDYKNAIFDDSDVFCQGSAFFRNVVREGCSGKQNVNLYFDQN